MPHRSGEGPPSKLGLAASTSELVFTPADLRLRVPRATAICGAPLGPDADVEFCGKILSAVGKDDTARAVALVQNPLGHGAIPFTVMVGQLPIEGTGSLTSEQIAAVRRGAQSQGNAAVLMPPGGTSNGVSYLRGRPLLHYSRELPEIGMRTVSYAFFRQASIVSLDVLGPSAQIDQVSALAEELAESVEMRNDVSADFGQSRAYVLGRRMGDFAARLAAVLAPLGAVALFVVKRRRRNATS